MISGFQASASHPRFLGRCRGNICSYLGVVSLICHSERGREASDEESVGWDSETRFHKPPTQACPEREKRVEWIPRRRPKGASLGMTLFSTPPAFPRETPWKKLQLPRRGSQ